MAEETSPTSSVPAVPPSKGASKVTPRGPSLPRQIGPYTLLERIGVGGMGSVYRASRPNDSTHVAIKVMAESTRSNPVLLRRFEQEFRAASRLDHPNMVRAIDYGEAEGVPYLVMELVQGMNLSDHIEEKGKLPEAEAIRLVGQVAQGLYRAHKMGLVHRDVKPDNILITADGQAKLTDLGLVKEAETDLNLTRTGRGLGTPHFMAPEQFKNAKLADSRCDIYSLGATLYAAVTGQTPFGGLGALEAWMKKVQDEFPSPKSLVPEISDRTDWAIRRAMASDPDIRPATCREFVEDLTGRTTRKVLSAPETDKDHWYLRHLDEQGAEVSVKGTRAAVRRSLREGLLGDASNVQAARSRQGPFLPLRDLPEFRDLIVTLPAHGAALAKVSESQPPPSSPARSGLETSGGEGEGSTVSLHSEKPSGNFRKLGELSRPLGRKPVPLWVPLAAAAGLFLGLLVLWLLLR